MAVVLTNEKPEQVEKNILSFTVPNKMFFSEQVEEQEQLKEYFRYAMHKRREKWSWEYDYWKEKGWL